MAEKIWDLDDLTLVQFAKQSESDDGDGDGDGEESDQQGKGKSKGKDKDKNKGKGGGKSDDSENGDDEDKDGDGGDGDGDEQDDEDADGEGKGKGGDEDGEDGDDAVNPDEWHKKIEDKLSKKSKGGQGDIHGKRDQNTLNDGSGTKGSVNKAQTIERKFIKPKFKWHEYLKNVVATVSSKPIETYIKPASNVATTASIGSQIGAAVLKPGEIKPEGNFKLGIVVDSSGSMSDVIAKIYTELESLLLKFKRLDNSFIFIRFSDSYEMFSVNIGKQSYSKINDISDKSPNRKSGSIKELFAEHYGSGTNFSSDLAKTIIDATTKGYHMIVISDQDILATSNLNNLRAVINSKNAGVIFNDKPTYVEGIKLLLARSNITYLD
jgi:hypothetical protein